jgi:NADH:ubiquinone oxidoreductase subunit 3 (subunit A)
MKQKKPRQQKPREAAKALVESAIAFILIVVAALLIYALGRRASPKPVQSETERSAYACGEKATFHGLKVNVSLYKFLIYFVIFDSSVILIAFASLVGQGRNVTMLILYLFLMLASGLILLEGGKDNE